MSVLQGTALLHSGTEALFFTSCVAGASVSIMAICEAAVVVATYGRLTPSMTMPIGPATYILIVVVFTHPIVIVIVHSPSAALVLY